MGTTGNRVTGKLVRGFESPSLRLRSAIEPRFWAQDRGFVVLRVLLDPVDQLGDRHAEAAGELDDRRQSRIALGALEQRDLSAMQARLGPEGLLRHPDIGTNCAQILSELLVGLHALSIATRRQIHYRQ